jgi:carbon monoxide dehydrogenase subunit G
VILDNDITIHAHPDVVFALINDVERVVTCLPGASAFPPRQPERPGYLRADRPHVPLQILQRQRFRWQALTNHRR